MASIGLPREVRALANAARHANIGTGFKYLELAQPALVLRIIGAIRHRSLAAEQEPLMQHLATLAQEAAGKRAISDQGMAFVEGCDPRLILNWCQLLGADQPMKEK